MKMGIGYWDKIGSHGITMKDNRQKKRRGRRRFQDVLETIGYAGSPAEVTEAKITQETIPTCEQTTNAMPQRIERCSREPSRSYTKNKSRRETFPKRVQSNRKNI